MDTEIANLKLTKGTFYIEFLFFYFSFSSRKFQNKLPVFSGLIWDFFYRFLL